MKRLLVFLLFALMACTPGRGSPDPSTTLSEPTSTIAPLPTSSIVPLPTSSKTSTVPLPTASKTTIPSVQPTFCESATKLTNPAIQRIRWGQHDTFDRVAFDFCNLKGQKIAVNVTYVKALTEDASGKSVNLGYPVSYQITLRYADSRLVANSFNLGLPNVKVLRNIGNFEGVASYGVGALNLRETRTGKTEIDDRTTYYVDIGH